MPSPASKASTHTAFDGLVARGPARHRRRCVLRLGAGDRAAVPGRDPRPRDARSRRDRPGRYRPERRLRGRGRHPARRPGRRRIRLDDVDAHEHPMTATRDRPSTPIRALAIRLAEAGLGRMTHDLVEVHDGDEFERMMVEIGDDPLAGAGAATAAFMVTSAPTANRSARDRPTEHPPRREGATAVGACGAVRHDCGTDRSAAGHDHAARAARVAGLGVLRRLRASPRRARPHGRRGADGRHRGGDRPPPPTKLTFHPTGGPGAWRARRARHRGPARARRRPSATDRPAASGGGQIAAAVAVTVVSAGRPGRLNRIPAGADTTRCSRRPRLPLIASAVASPGRHASARADGPARRLPSTHQGRVPPAAPTTTQPPAPSPPQPAPRRSRPGDVLVPRGRRQLHRQLRTPNFGLPLGHRHVRHDGGLPHVRSGRERSATRWKKDAGGNAAYLFAANGNVYYYAHLSAFVGVAQHGHERRDHRARRSNGQRDRAPPALRDQGGGRQRHSDRPVRDARRGRLLDDFGLIKSRAGRPPSARSPRQGTGADRSSCRG